MALRNGVLVHGPTSWACAVRLPDGSIKVAVERKKLIGNTVENPLLRGPARLLEALAVLPALKKKLPEAKLPFEQPRIIGAMVASAAGVRAVRGWIFRRCPQRAQRAAPPRTKEERSERRGSREREKSCWHRTSCPSVWSARRESNAKFFCYCRLHNPHESAHGWQ